MGLIGRRVNSLVAWDLQSRWRTVNWKVKLWRALTAHLRSAYLIQQAMWRHKAFKEDKHDRRWTSSQNVQHVQEAECKKTDQKSVLVLEKSKNEQN